MIDSYMDRADRATGYRPTPSRPVSEDPRYWNGQLYATVIDRNVARAKAKLKAQVAVNCITHSFEVRFGIKLGDGGSCFTKQGRRK